MEMGEGLLELNSFTTRTDMDVLTGEKLVSRGGRDDDNAEEIGRLVRDSGRLKRELRKAEITWTHSRTARLDTRFPEQCPKPRAGMGAGVGTRASSGGVSCLGGRWTLAPHLWPIDTLHSGLSSVEIPRADKRSTPSAPGSSPLQAHQFPRRTVGSTPNPWWLWPALLSPHSHTWEHLHFLEHLLPPLGCAQVASSSGRLSPPSWLASGPSLLFLQDAFPDDPRLPLLGVPRVLQTFSSRAVTTWCCLCSGLPCFPIDGTRAGSLLLSNTCSRAWPSMEAH